jgi:hypothetical protein
VASSLERAQTNSKAASNSDSESCAQSNSSTTLSTQAVNDQSNSCAMAGLEQLEIHSKVGGLLRVTQAGQRWRLTQHSPTLFVGSRLTKGTQYPGTFNRTRNLCRGNCFRTEIYADFVAETLVYSSIPERAMPELHRSWKMPPPPLFTSMPVSTR